MDYRLIPKCKRIILDSAPDVAMKKVAKLMSEDKEVLSASFLPASADTSPYPEYKCDATKGVCDALIPIKDGQSCIAILRISYTTPPSPNTEYYRNSLEWMCLCFNRDPEKVVVREGTPWGTVEVRQTDFTHVNYYWPDKAALYTSRVLQYYRPEEIDQFIEKELGLPGKEKLIDEHFELNYPLFKMRIRMCDDSELSHEMDSDGVWWINCPKSYDLTRRNAYLYVREYFKKVITSAAEEYFPKRVAYMESRMHTGKKIAKIECKFITTRNADAWNHMNPESPYSTRDDGTRDLRFDPKLMAYPAKYTDQVIIHELCHNIYFDHTKKFRELEEKWCLAITGYGPHYYDDFFRTHHFCLFAKEPFKSLTK